MMAMPLFSTRGNRMLYAGCALLLVIIIGAIFADHVSPYNPLLPDYAIRLQAPGTDHFFGTDELGRDILSRVLHGSRVSLAIGFLSQIIAYAIGISLGMIAGWYGRWMDDVLMRVADIFFAVPGLMFLVVWNLVFGSDTVGLAIALGVLGWPESARLIRAQVLAARAREYIVAAQAIGVPVHRILRVHLFPNTVAPLIGLMPLGIAGAILSEATLSFLGLGVKIPLPTWANMVDTGRQYISSAWWYMVVPSAAIFLTILALHFVAEGFLTRHRS